MVLTETGETEFFSEPSKLFGFGGVAFFRSPTVGLSGTESALASLASLAAAEPWADSTGPYGVLHNYVQYTFRRLYDEGKLVETTGPAGPKVMAFHTGLYTPMWQAIYGCLKENPIPDKQPWYFNGWFTEADAPMKPFVGIEPRRAEYFTDPRDLLFDPRLKFVESTSHVLAENVDRYPLELQADPFRRHQALSFAVGVAKTTVEQNWQVAVPMFYFAHAPGQSPISLLLPLCLLEPGKADMALVIARYGDLQYKAFTVLDLEQAYRSARLLAKPAAAWLGQGGVLDPGQPVNTDAGWRKVGQRDRCPVCGQSTGCIISTDNKRVVCRRIADGGQPIPNRSDCWAHRIGPVPAEPSPTE